MGGERDCWAPPKRGAPNTAQEYVVRSNVIAARAPVLTNAKGYEQYKNAEIFRKPL